MGGNMTIDIGYEERMTYLHALKTRQATPASSAVFRKILQHAVHAANATYNAVQLELFNDLPSEKHV
jgi:hypothetical protein